MSFKVTILKDSVNVSGSRITTMELVYPRFCHSEFLTHRVFSRNSASSRAIPISKMVKSVWSEPVTPVWFGAHQSGMQAHVELKGLRLSFAKFLWFFGGRCACVLAWLMMKLGMHKQLVNRVIEPWSFITVIVTATEWDNFFALRCHPDAQPEIREIAVLMRAARDASVPKFLGDDEYHLPLVDDFSTLIKDGYSIDKIIKISVGRCARVSYLTHDGVRDPQKDIELCEKLQSSGHMSPLEHVAYPIKNDVRCGNFIGWRQVRKDVSNEDNFSRVIQEI